jgi:ribonuclease P protein component
MGTGPGEGFPKALRLRKRPQFLRVQEGGVKVSTGPLLALPLRNEGGPTRLGLTISSKVGNAVTRVRIRRRLRELFRKRRSALPVGVDLVLIARGSAKDAEYEALVKAFDTIAARLKGLFP